MPLIWWVIFEPNWDILHEVDLKYVIRSEVPIKWVRILRSNDCDVPIWFRPIRIDDHSLIEFKSYQTLFSSSINDRFIDDRDWDFVAECWFTITLIPKLYFSAVSIAPIPIFNVLIIANFRALNDSVSTISDTSVCCFIISSVASPSFLNSTNARTAVSINIVSIVTLVVS